MSDDRRVDRRTLLTATAGGIGLALTGLLAACTPDRTPRPTNMPPDGATASSPPGPDSWAALSAALGSRLLRPGAATWSTATRLQNPRWDGADPLGIALVNGAEDVVACIAFARRTGTPVALRAGGHSYTGWSAGGAPGSDVPPSLVISTQNLTSVTLSSDQQEVTVGPGATLITVYRALAAAGRAIGAGSCPTVGVGGLTLGGGVGVLARSFGLTCDQLTSVQIVTADGTVRTASATENPDLFWACRGGSGGVVGVVTAMTFRTQAAPTVSRFFLAFPWSSAGAVVGAWQQWAPKADERLWSTMKLLGGARHPDGPAITVAGTWTGSAGDLDGQLEPFLQSVGVAPFEQTAVTASYGATMDFYAGTTGIPTAQCTTGPGGQLTRVPEAATSHIGMQPLGSADIATLVAQVERASAVAGLVEGGVSFDALGGAVGKLGATATAFPWRSAAYDVQYTATFAVGADASPYDSYVRGFRATMQSAWGNTGYSNYVDAAVTDPTVYFGDNTARLRSIVRRWNASSLFRQPHWV